MPESIADDIIQLFPHNFSVLVFNITPLTAVPAQTSAHTPTFTVPSKPTLPSHPRTTTSAPSSPRKESRDDIRVIRRTQQRGESSQARAKIALRTSGVEDLDYIPTDVLEEHRLAEEALKQNKSQDRRLPTSLPNRKLRKPELKTLFSPRSALTRRSRRAKLKT